MCMMQKSGEVLAHTRHDDFKLLSEKPTTQNLSVAGPQMTLDGAAVTPVACITPPWVSQEGFGVSGL